MRKILLLPFVNVYQPEAESGSLTVQKEVVGDNPDPDKEFTFEVTFSDGGTYTNTPSTAASRRSL